MLKIPGLEERHKRIFDFLIIFFLKKSNYNNNLKKKKVFLVKLETTHKIES